MPGATTRRRRIALWSTPLARRLRACPGMLPAAPSTTGSDSLNSARHTIVASVVGIAIFVGLPLLGWGLGDLRGFVADPVRLAYVMLAALASISLAILVPPAGRRPGEEHKRVRRQRLAIVLLQVVSLTLVVIAPYDDRREIAVLPVPAIRGLGLALFVLGQVAVSWAQVTLDRQFSVEVTIQKDHRLVTEGVYRYLRHPRYLGIIVFTLGFALVFHSGLGLSLVAAETLVLLWRIRDEEALLHREFGPAWEAYAERSWRLIPFVF